MLKLVLLLFVLVSIGLMFLVILQAGNAESFSAGGAAAGASATLFGASGAVPALTRLTGVFATLFFLLALLLTRLLMQRHSQAYEEIIAPIESNLQLPSESVIEAPAPQAVLPAETDALPETDGVSSDISEQSLPSQVPLMTHSVPQMAPIESGVQESEVATVAGSDVVEEQKTDAIVEPRESGKATLPIDDSRMESEGAPDSESENH